MADYDINAVTRRTVYDGSIGLGPYAFSFEVLGEEDIAVYFNTTKLTITTDYTVTINANGTGSVTLVVDVNVPDTPTADDTVTLVGARDIERVTDFVTGGDFPAVSINTQLDALTIFDQQLADEGKRSLMAPVYDPQHVDDGGALDMTLPRKADRLGKVLAFNLTTGNPEVTYQVTDFVIGTVTTLATGQPATASVTVANGVGTLNLGLPAGPADTSSLAFAIALG